MPTTSSDSASSTEPRSMVWLWERAPGSVELQKVRVPVAIVPPGWLEPLQRRYHHGDRVSFTWHEEACIGTIVQDQGMYVAVDGDPDGGYTLHKTYVSPLGLQHEPEPPAVAATVPAGTPHDPPSIRTSDRTITARWNLGAPTAEHWQRQASLRVIHDGPHGFVATLSSVDEFDHGDFHHERPCGAVPIAIHYQLALRYSQKGLRDTFHAALREVRAAFDNGEPDIVDHFSRPAVGDQPDH